ncbi:hypothetical protein [Aggregatibacter segnis]|uniref:hypothetical protein n=1 Tax=Aggregatibacter segnis TaxID=739 RepID=UPI00065F8662|nr:hypothetical protein [Aggregatibacter segnis]
MFIRHQPAIQVGLCYHPQHIDVLWFDSQNQAQFLQCSELDLLTLSSTLNQKLNQSPRRANYKFITAIMPQHIWQKSLILPQNLNTQECEQQCHFTLTHELPIPLEEVWYDYTAMPLKQGFRLDIFAIRQQIAKNYLNQFIPLQIDVLDSVAKAVLRASEYILEQPLPIDALVLYQDESGALAIHQKRQQTQTLFQTDGNLTALFEQYCQRYDEKPEKVFYYSTESTPHIASDWVEINTSLPFIALGNALWQQETLQKSTALFGVKAPSLEKMT